MTDAPKFAAPVLCPPPGAGRRPAFTLLELLIALAIAAVLAAGMFASIRVGFKARSSSEAAVEPGRTAELAMELLRLDIENALPPNTTSTSVLAGNFEGSDQTDDRGNPGDVLDFYTTADSPEHVAGNGEIKWVELAVESVGTDHLLVRRVQRNIAPLSTNPPIPDEEVLCRGVSGFNLRYYDGNDWQDVWDSTSAENNNALPAAVEVTLELERPVPGGQTQTSRFVRVFVLSCSVTTPGSNGGINGGSGFGF